MFSYTSIVETGGCGMLRLCLTSSKGYRGRPLVKMSAIWYRKGTYNTQT